MKIISEITSLSSPILRSKYLFWIFFIGFFFCSQAQGFKKIDAQSIISQIKKGKPINIQNAEIIGDLDFTKVGFFRETMQNERVFIQSPLFFQNCKFRGQIIGFKQRDNDVISCSFTKNLSFVNCIFYQNIELNGSIFTSVCDFSESQFYGLVHFENSNFDRPVLFRKAIFAKESFFQNTQFRSNIDFSQAIFNQNVHFQGSDFYDLANFRQVDFRESLDFSLCTVFKNISFNYFTIKNKGLFNNCRFDNRLEFENIKANRIEMDEAVFRGETLFNDIDCSVFSIKRTFFFHKTPSVIFTQPDKVVFLFEDSQSSNQKQLEFE